MKLYNQLLEAILIEICLKQPTKEIHSFIEWITLHGTRICTVEELAEDQNHLIRGFDGISEVIRISNATSNLSYLVHVSDDAIEELFKHSYALKGLILQNRNYKVFLNAQSIHIKKFPIKV